MVLSQKDRSALKVLLVLLLVLVSILLFIMHFRDFMGFYTFRPEKTHPYLLYYPYRYHAFKTLLSHLFIVPLVLAYVVYHLLSDEKISLTAIFFASFSTVSIAPALIIVCTLIAYALTDIKILVFEDPKTILIQFVLSFWVWVVFGFGIVSAAIAEVLSKHDGANTHVLLVMLSALFFFTLCYGTILLFMTIFNILNGIVTAGFGGREHSIIPHTLFGLSLILLSSLFFLRKEVVRFLVKK